MNIKKIIYNIYEFIFILLIIEFIIFKIINFKKNNIENCNISYGELAELQSYEDRLMKVANFSKEDARNYINNIIGID